MLVVSVISRFKRISCRTEEIRGRPSCIDLREPKRPTKHPGRASYCNRDSTYLARTESPPAPPRPTAPTSTSHLRPPWSPRTPTPSLRGRDSLLPLRCCTSIRCTSLLVQPARIHCNPDTTAARPSCRSPSHLSCLQHRTTGTRDHTTFPQALPASRTGRQGQPDTLDPWRPHSRGAAC